MLKKELTALCLQKEMKDALISGQVGFGPTVNSSFINSRHVFHSLITAL